jgi:hypothetical protein
MKIRININRTLWMVLLSVLISCSSPVTYYSVSDFEKVPKIDAHFHYFSMDGRYMEFASTLNFRLLSPNYDGEYSIDEQNKITSSIQRT